MKILCAGDLHLGRRSSRVPEGATQRHSATSAWDAIVELALAERVAIVALSGDLVDRANRYFEAFGPLERGVRRLAGAGIGVVAVAGNHDFDVLPRLAPRLGKGFRLLGAGGRWQGLTVPQASGPGVRIVGWSFPAERVDALPLAAFPALPDDGVPTLALAHADLDATGGRYAPVSAAALRALPVSCWLLGHIHAPRLREVPGGASILYPGSPQALDPGEPGAHGAWILELAPERRPALRLHPLSTVRYDALEVDVTDADSTAALEDRVAEGVRSHLAAVVAEGCGPLRELLLRVRVSGSTPVHREVAGHLAGPIGDLRVEHGEVGARVTGVEAATRPARDLDALAATPDAPGVLARFVLAVERGTLDEGGERLLRELADRATAVRESNPYRTLGGGVPAAEALRALARDRALLLLDALLAQKEAA